MGKLKITESTLRHIVREALNTLQPQNANIQYDFDSIDVSYGGVTLKTEDGNYSVYFDYDEEDNRVGRFYGAYSTTDDDDYYEGDPSQIDESLQAGEISQGLYEVYMDAVNDASLPRDIEDYLVDRWREESMSDTELYFGSERGYWDWKGRP